MEKLEKEQSVKLETLRKYATDLTNMAQKVILWHFFFPDHFCAEMCQVTCKIVIDQF